MHFVYIRLYLHANHQRVQLYTPHSNYRTISLHLWTWCRAYATRSPLVSRQSLQSTTQLTRSSEFYGRRPIYLVSFTFFLIWQIPSAVAKNIQTMLIARFFDGLSGSAFLSVAGGTVGDLFKREDLQFPMMIFTVSPFVGPAVGPLLGGFINQYTTWRWTFYMLMIWTGANLGAIAFLVPETYHPVLLRRKARILRAETGDKRWQAPMEKTNKSIPKTISLSLLRPIQLLCLEPMVTCLCLFSAILLGILYLFFGYVESPF